MNRFSATPIDIVERYFDVELKRSSLKHFGEITDQEWVDFAKFYLQVMEAQFGEQFLGGSDGLRLFFEPRMAHEWAAAVERLHGSTPLLGLSPDPGNEREINRNAVSQMLGPLKKHLLFADSLYIRDSFYYCFDAVADSVDRERWRDEPNVADLVRESIRKLKGWLPILIELRGLIESRALVFMPYYLTPSFPFAGESPALKDALGRIRVRPREPKPAPPDPVHIDLEKFFEAPKLEKDLESESTPWINTHEVLGAWLNARLLGLDPVFPNRTMFDWAADLYFEEEGGRDLTGDLISMDVLPFGRTQELGIDQLISLRKNEEVFAQVRETVSSCKEFLEKDIGPESSREGISKATKAFLDDRLADFERNSVLRFVEDKPIAGIAVSLAVGAALIPVAPAISVVAGAVLTPQLALLAHRRFDPKRRAVGRLQALL
jgi:hypothetical protein